MRHPVYPQPTFSQSAGIYIWRVDDDILYIGKAKNLRNRLKTYYAKPERLEPKTRVLMQKVQTVEWFEVDTEEEALLLEEELIKRHKPPFNIRLKDDKRYPYIAITNDAYPRILYTRSTEYKRWRYYGRYSDAGAVRQAVDAIDKVYLLPLWQDNWQKRGNPPVTRETWLQTIAKIQKILEGKLEWRTELEEKMQQAAEELNFEYAARLRDWITAISYLQPRQVHRPTNSCDILGWAENEEGGNLQILQLRADRLVGKRSYAMDVGSFESAVLEAYRLEDPPVKLYSSYLPQDASLVSEALGAKLSITPSRLDRYQQMADKNATNTLRYLQTHERVKDPNNALQSLADILDIPLPRRIECYDISNLGDSQPVAAMTVMIDGKAQPSLYRRWSLESSGQDDFAMIHDTITMRLLASNSQEKRLADLPDLIVIDGGKGQLSAAYKAMQEQGFDIPLISLAKRYEEVFQVGSQYPIGLAKNDQASLLLQHLRNETHRTAVEAHRRRRKKATFAEDFLADLRGIGPARRQKLLDTFGDLESILAASETDLELVLGQALAPIVYRQLHR